MATAIDFELKTLLEGSSRVFWAGSMPPLERMHASDGIFDAGRDYRMPPELHQTFDLAYLVERDLGGLKAWPLIVDEALRLLAPGGLLVIRMTNSPLVSIFELKHQLFMWGEMKPQFEHTCEDGATLFAVKNVRAAPRRTSLEGFSFGVITDGKRQGQLFAFLESAFALEHADSEVVEVLVCGPAAIQGEVEAAFPGVVFVAEAVGFADQGWITRKKNQLVERATQENVVIAHDRYTLAPDFIPSMHRFGADFSFMVCRQVRPDGRRFPDWVALGSEWSWSAPGMLDYGDWTRHLYINGGIMIAKKPFLEAIPWNELLFWNQAEDVELTRRLRGRGHVPRLAREVTACSRVMRQGTMESFEPLPLLGDRYLGPGPVRVDGVFVSPGLPYAQLVQFSASWARAAARLGVYVDEHWAREADGLALAPGKWGEVSFRLQAQPAGALELLLSVHRPGRALEVLVNDVPAAFEEPSPGRLRLRIPRERFVVNRVMRIHLRPHSAGFKLQALRVVPEGWTTGDPLPMTREAAEDVVGSAGFPRWLDGGALCLADLSLLARGARRIAVLVPGDLGSLIGISGFLATLRGHARPECVIRIVADASTQPFMEGFDGQAMDWHRFGSDLPYRLDSVKCLDEFEPDLIVNGFGVRTFLSDLLVHEVHALGVLGFEASDYESDAHAVDSVRARYTRRIPLEESGVSDALIRTLALPPVRARLWPDANSRASAEAATGRVARYGVGMIALLGDDPDRLDDGRLSREIEGHLADGRTVVGLGGKGTFDTLERALAPFEQGVLNLGGALGLASIYAVLSESDGCMGGSPLFRSLAELAGCEPGSGRMASKQFQLRGACCPMDGSRADHGARR